MDIDLEQNFEEFRIEEYRKELTTAQKRFKTPKEFQLYLIDKYSHEGPECPEGKTGWCFGKTRPDGFISPAVAIINAFRNTKVPKSWNFLYTLNGSVSTNLDHEEIKLYSFEFGKNLNYDNFGTKDPGAKVLSWTEKQDKDFLESWLQDIHFKMSFVSFVVKGQEYCWYPEQKALVETRKLKIYFGVPIEDQDTLAGAKLHGLVFKNRLLTGCDMSNGDFSGSCFSRCDFSGADLTNANFSGCDLSFANFFGANLQGANMENCNLKFCNFEKTDLRKTAISKSKLDKKTALELFHKSFLRDPFVEGLIGLGPGMTEDL